ncbi:hypothetical protein [Deinococcus petrolearius]|uniref:Lipoprotein n=1 Tax=Deinococcus petrolearius TaxID=1751295 RepID=A0ABW1DHM6_9DEIO
MKKGLLAAVGLSGLLASCGGTLTVGAGGYYGEGTSSSLILNSLTDYQTNWQLSTAVQDQKGNVIPAGTHVICDNTTTDISFNVNWTGYMAAVGLQLRGLNTDSYKNIGVFLVNSSTGRVNATYSIGSNIAPLNLKPQAIIVNPITSVDIKGYTYVRAQGIDGTAAASNVVSTSTAIPVVDCQ